MEQRQEDRLAAFKRADAFIDWRAPELEAVVRSTLRARLGACIEQIEQDAVTQRACEANALAKSERVRELRRELRNNHLRPLVSIGRARRMDITIPTIAEFDVPTDRASHWKLLSAAQAMRDAAAECQDLFISEGLPATFLDDLDAAILALRHAVVERDMVPSVVRGATVRIVESLSSAQVALTALTSMVGVAFKNDLAAMAEWRAAIRVGRKRSPTKAPAISATATVVIEVPQAAAPVTKALPTMVRRLPGAATGWLRAIARKFGPTKVTALIGATRAREDAQAREPIRLLKAPDRVA